MTAVTAKNNTGYSPKCSMQSFAELLLATFERSRKVYSFLAFLCSFTKQYVFHLYWTTAENSTYYSCSPFFSEGKLITSRVHKTITGVVEKSGIKWQVINSSIFKCINYWHTVLSLRVSGKLSWLQSGPISFRLGVFASVSLSDWKGCAGLWNSLWWFFSTLEFPLIFPTVASSLNATSEANVCRHMDGHLPNLNLSITDVTRGQSQQGYSPCVFLLLATTAPWQEILKCHHWDIPQGSFMQRLWAYKQVQPGAQNQT